MFSIIKAGAYDSISSRLEEILPLEAWQFAPDSRTTEVRQVDGTYWLSCPKIGAISFELLTSDISSYPANGIHPDVFQRVLIHEWLPLVYQAWGIQVLHASAVLQRERGIVIAFAGETGTGKSTFGYGLGERHGWQQIADDGLAFTIRDAGVHLHSIPNAVRLRHSSIEYFPGTNPSHTPLPWPEGQLNLDTIFFLEPNSGKVINSHVPIQIEPLNGAQAYPMLLQQAYALTIKIPGHNQLLLRAYLELAGLVHAFRLVYPQTLSILEEALDMIEREICEA